MKYVLLATAALLAAAALPAVAEAQSRASPGSQSMRGSDGSSFRGDFRGRDRDGFRQDRRDRGQFVDGRRDRRRDRFDDAVVVGPWEWDEDYGARTWQSDSYNDWWHNQPWRSYPAWVQRNQNCDRMWWSGNSLRC